MKRRTIIQWSLAPAAALAFRAAVAQEGTGDFFRAIIQDNAGALRRLLERGVDPNSRNERGVPGLYLALQEGSLAAAGVLLDAPRLNVNELNASGESALMMAALKGHIDLARRLIGQGADVNQTGWTPLHYAATAGNVAMIELLLAHGADIDARSPNETTPLMMAAQYGSPEAVKLLLARGAKVDARNQQDMTALDFAKLGERSDSAEILAAAARSRQPVRSKGW